MMQPSENSIESILSQFRSGLCLRSNNISMFQFRGFIAPDFVQLYLNMLK